MTKLGPYGLNSIVTAGCEDCELPYQKFGIDAVLSNEQWILIHPEGTEGLLCANCIMKRAAFLSDIIIARVTFVMAQEYDNLD